MAAKHTWIFRAQLLALFVASGLPGAAQETCLGFGELAAGTSLRVGSNFVSAGVACAIEPFQYSMGTWTTNGSVRLDSRSLTNLGAAAPHLWLGNASVRFEIGRATDLRLTYGAFGGNLNLRINGVLTNFGSMTALDGAELGGVRLSVAPRTAARGELRAAGLLTDFAVGGQELAIDDLCVVPYAGPKWRGVRATQGGEVQLTFTYPGTDPAGVTIWWSDAVGTSAVWRRDDRATVTAVATNEFQVFTMRPEGWGSAYYRLEAPVR